MQRGIAVRGRLGRDGGSIRPGVRSGRRGRGRGLGILGARRVVGVQALLGLIVGNARGLEPGGLLEQLHRRLGLASEGAVAVVQQEAQHEQAVLQFEHRIALVPLGQRGVGHRRLGSGLGCRRRRDGHPLAIDHGGQLLGGGGVLHLGDGLIHDGPARGGILPGVTGEVVRLGDVHQYGVADIALDVFQRRDVQLVVHRRLLGHQVVKGGGVARHPLGEGQHAAVPVQVDHLVDVGILPMGLELFQAAGVQRLGDALDLRGVLAAANVAEPQHAAHDQRRGHHHDRRHAQDILDADGAAIADLVKLVLVDIVEHFALLAVGAHPGVVVDHLVPGGGIVFLVIVHGAAAAGGPAALGGFQFLDVILHLAADPRAAGGFDGPGAQLGGIHALHLQLFVHGVHGILNVLGKGLRRR